MLKSDMDSYKIKALLEARISNPFEILGPHKLRNGLIVVRAYLPHARRVWIITNGEEWEFKRHEGGIFEIKLKELKVKHYILKTLNYDETTEQFIDPYSFREPVLGELDIHLINEGTHHRIYDKLGAHIMGIDSIAGTHFSVWAPNAERVSVIGDFNRWDPRIHMMRVLGSSGIWEIFIPGVREGALYKYEIRSRYHHNVIRIKSDPFAFYSELRPKTASIVTDINSYRWNDHEWMEKRKTLNPYTSPISIYEVHPGSWMRIPEEGNRFLNYRELAYHLIPYVKEMGFTHIELMPLTEHPFDGSWGYQTTGYYSATSRYGKPEDLMYFIDKCHQNDIGVILDWVPSHFASDDHGLRFFDGTCLYEHEDPRKGYHPDWSSLVFNYARNEVKNFLIGSALFWLDKYHADGLRVDAVASMLYLDYSRKEGEWVPNIYGGKENLEAISFLKYFNETAHHYFPGVLTIAEESTAWPIVSRPTYLGGLGFSMKWNMGWMHDTLQYFSKDPIFRKYHHENLTFSLLYAFSENFILPLSHDEVVHGKGSLLGKMPGDPWQKFANLRLLYGYMFGHPGKKLLFMGGEFGQWREWDYSSSIDWHLLQYESHRGIQLFIRDLNRLLRTEPSMYEVDFHHKGFEWIDFRDYSNSVISFIRRSKNPEDFLIFVFNFTPVVRFNYRIGVPLPGYYREVLNSDSSIYWGSNIGNKGGVLAEPVPIHGRPYSLNLVLPPLAVLVFKRMI